MLYVKRVIGLPGDTVRIEGNTIHVHGVLLEQDVLTRDADTLLGVETISGREHAFKLGTGRAIRTSAKRSRCLPASCS